MLVPCFFIGSIYSFMGQDPTVAAYAAKYVRYVAPGIYFNIQGIATEDCAIAMKYTSARLIANGFGTLIHILCIILFVHVFDWGFDGVALATGLQFFFRFIAAVSYINCIKPMR